MSAATDRLALYLAAEQAVLGGQSYRDGDLHFTRADLEAIQNGIKDARAQVRAEAQSTTGRAGFAIADFRRDCD